MHPLTSKFCTEILPDTVLTNRTGEYGFVILNNGRIFHLHQKFTHDLVACMLLWDDVESEINRRSLNFNALIDNTSVAPLSLGSITFDLPIIRYTQRHEYNSHTRFYDLWFNENAITIESYQAWRLINYTIYGADGYEEVDGPGIPGSHINNVNAYNVHLKNTANKVKTEQNFVATFNTNTF